MEDKVSVGLFRPFAEERHILYWNADNPSSNPVLGVNAEDAYAFAKWLCGSVGDLPTREEWDKAAGLNDYPTDEGPYQGKWDAKTSGLIAVGIKEPMSVGTAKADIGRFGCRDMAGNGRELTGSIVDGGRIPPPDTEKDPIVWLRGCRFNGGAPLDFRSLRREAETGKPAVGVLSYRQPPPRDVDTSFRRDVDTSFRVVIEPGRPDQGK
jgi:formylglycine-generating enzyme required for sulfatase activity